MSMFHVLTTDAPSTADLLRGGWGLVAQCSCGQYEYTASKEEAGYWHWLHSTMPSATPYGLLARMVNQPMPEGWTAPVEVEAPVNQATHVCGICSGQGDVETYGSADGRFYQMGSRRPCQVCGGSGKLNADQVRIAIAAAVAA